MFGVTNFVKTFNGPFMSKVVSSSGSPLLSSSLIPSSWNPLPVSFRCASKKAAGGGNRNPKKAPGKHKGIKIQDGNYVYPGDVIVYRQGTKKIWFHPGLNVTIAKRYMNLVALKEGFVKVTTEKPDLNFETRYVKLFYTGREGVPFYKKHFNVIPPPQHTQFRCIDQI